MDARVERRAWLAGEWAARLGQILESMTEQPPRVSCRPAPAGTDAAAVTWWEQTFSVRADAPFWVGVPESVWMALGTRILNAAGIEEVPPEEARSTFVELLGQSLESLAHAMGAVLGAEVLCASRTECAAAPPAPAFFAVEAAWGESVLAGILVAASDQLAEASSPAPPETASAALAPAEPASGAPAAASQDARMLDLLLDVELPVSISFGRTQLPLREALKLTTGSVVELNRTVTEPVDVIVNNCVIARGEVVVIEGNYGVRIREIMSRQDRLRNLR